jgi:hypothetical protein
MKYSNAHRLLALAYFGFDIIDIPDREPCTSIGVLAVAEPEEDIEPAPESRAA